MGKRNIDDLFSEAKHPPVFGEYTLYLARRYMVNVLHAAKFSRRIRSDFESWIDNSELFQELLDDPQFAEVPSESLRLNLKIAFQVLEQKTSRPPEFSLDATATRLVVDRFSLGAAAAALLELAHCYTHCALAKDIWDGIARSCNNPVETMTLILRRPRLEIERGLRELADVGIADWEVATRVRGHHDPDDLINDFMWEVWQPPVREMGELTARLVGDPLQATLCLDDFAHMGERDDTLRFLRATKNYRTEGLDAQGVNILLWGRAGTGKTEFAKTVAAASGMTLFPVGELRNGDEESHNAAYNRRADRRNELRMAQTLLQTMPEAAILCDEAEDALESTSGSRLVNHRMIEENPVPVIYTANKLKDLDESMLRRFTMVVRFTAHGPTRQTGILTRMLAETGISGIDVSACAQRLVDRLECPPGIVAKAIETTRLLDGTEADLYEFCERAERTISAHKARPRLGPPIGAALPLKAFSHLGPTPEDVRRTLAAAMDSKPRGINILLHGPPGTGKTEFARTLCREVGARMYAIGNNEVGSRERLGFSRTKTLDYALESLADEPAAVIFFDEMEDFYSVEKHWLNRIVEENPVPIIWACNDIDYYRRIQPFFIDRMMHAIEFRRMSVGARKRVFSGILTKARVSDVEARRLATELAHDDKVTPRHLALAAHQAAMIAGNADVIRRNIEQKVKLRYGVRPVESVPIEHYDLSLVNADTNLEALTARMVGIGAKRFALCLYGPPGTGKTAFVRHIAERMGMELLPKRASDLLSMWVGQTEQQMAAAFAEAIETGSFLVFDEADSLLMDREHAVRSWETSMVNELLSQMERHPLPFACTTNRREALDPAAARRFLFRVELFYMDRQRVDRAFRLFFGCDAPLEALELDRLTPADFANVRERAKILNFLDDPVRIGRALEEECRHKPGVAPLGF